MVNFYRLHPKATLPFHQTEQAAGRDLSCIEDFTIMPGEVKIVGTGLSIQLPDGVEAQIRSRSGLAAKYGIAVLNSPGTIDPDYTGEIKVILVNHGKNACFFTVGERIAQMVLANFIRTEVSWTEATVEKARGDGGLGSTGTK